MRVRVLFLRDALITHALSRLAQLPKHILPCQVAGAQHARPNCKVCAIPAEPAARCSYHCRGARVCPGCLRSRGCCVWGRLVGAAVAARGRRVGTEDGRNGAGETLRAAMQARERDKAAETFEFGINDLLTTTSWEAGSDVYAKPAQTVLHVPR